MSTIINNPPTNDSTVVQSDSSGGWAIAVIILLVVIAVGAYFWINRTPVAQTTQQPNVNIDVTIPHPVTSPSLTK